MNLLSEKKCQVCEGGVEPLDKEISKKMLQQIPGWQIDENNEYIFRNFTFKRFLAAVNFLNLVAFIAEKEGHHPEIELGYNYCKVKFSTHAIKGLSENDFICAAKINANI